MVSTTKRLSIVLFLLLSTYGVSLSQCSEFDIINLKKIAIVFGEKDYKFAGPLRNPINDAQDISDSLKSVGFTVYTHYNTDFKTMTNAIDEWYTKLPKYDVALFYYSGHGAEVNGENYLFPIDANPKGISDLHYMAYSANRLLANMETKNSKFNIMILDACRNNPFTKSWARDIRNGLASMSGKGSFIGFAASPGNVADDGDKRNGLYTEAILKYIIAPNLTIDQIFTKVNSDVRNKSKGGQIPYKNSSLSADFCFKVKNNRTGPAVLKSTYTQPSSAILLAVNEEKLFTVDSLGENIIVTDSKTVNQIGVIKGNGKHPFKIISKGGDNIYAIDTATRTFNIFSIKTGVIKQSVIIPNRPNSFAISNDERKAYISGDKYSLTGGIYVVDLMIGKIIKTITFSGISQGLVVAPGGKYVYVTASCDNNKGGLFVIDVKTDKVIKSYEGIACGEALGILPNGKKVYSSYMGEGGVNQINVIDGNTTKVIKQLDAKSSAFAFTADSKYVFSLSKLEVLVIRVDDDVIVNRLPFVTAPDGIAISDNGIVFVGLSKESRTFVFPVGDALQAEPPIDPEVALKNFKEENRKNANINTQYRIGDLFKEADLVIYGTVDNIIREIGGSYGYLYGRTESDYKNLVSFTEIGIKSKLDESKKIYPVFQVKCIGNIMSISLKEGDKEEMIKFSIDDIDWEKAKKFVRSYYLSRLNQLK